MADLSPDLRHRCDETFGAVVAANLLRFPRAIEVVSYLTMADRGPFVRFVEARRLPSQPEREAIIVELAPELGTERVVDIHYTEFFALVFDERDERYPRALAIRENFPRPIHLNFEVSEFSSCASLCLYDQPWGDIKLTWTPRQFLNRIGEWLTKASQGALHAPNQALECFMVFSGITLVMPHALMQAVSNRPLVALNLQPISRPGESWMVFRSLYNQNQPDPKADGYSVITQFKCPPVTHGLIKACPTNLGELDELFRAAGWSLINEFSERIKGDPGLINTASRGDARMIIMLAVPMRREDESEPERTDTWAFQMTHTLGEFAEAVGLVARAPGGAQYLPLVGQAKPEVVAPALAQSRIIPMRVLESIDRAKAANFTGETSHYDGRVIAVGAGALGAQIVLNLARGGFGFWTIVDEDIVLPHNIVRHFAPSDWIGCSKSAALHEVVSGLYDQPEFHRYIHANVLSATPDQREALNEAASKADHIFDFSASVSVARYLSAMDCVARRSCAFITASGNDLIVMSEDVQRTVKLDWLEMEFYAALIADEDLSASVSGSATKVNYGLGCRDRSVVLSQDTVGMYAGIASRGFRQIINCDSASLKLYQIETQTGSVSCRSINVEKPFVHVAGGWEIQYSRKVAESIQLLRQSKLPNETGGVLLGTWDVSRKRCYVYHALPAPRDSNEAPDYFERGCESLSANIEVHSRRTNGMTTYVGEWHSHPRGASTLPSCLDVNAALWFQSQLQDDGLPSVMFIVGDDMRPRIVCAFSINHATS